MTTPPLDARRVRFAHGLSAILVLGGFVFGAGWIMPLVALMLLAGAIGGPSAHVGYFAYDLTLGPRLRPPTEFEDPAEARFADGCGAAILAVATLPWLAGLTWLAWFVGLGYAAMASVAATTGASLPRLLRARLNRRG